ncbi:hypothetical protein ABFX02_01G079800 [Erythranthe guttata]
MDDGGGGGGGGGGDESRAGLYRVLLDRFQSLEASQQKLRQQFEVVLQEETTKKGPASDSGDVTSFPDWGFPPWAYFSGSPYRNVLEYMGHAVHVCSRIRSWEITYWNRAAEKLYGYKDHEVVGQKDVKLIFSEEHHLSALAIMERLTNGESWSGQLPLNKRSGQTFMAMVTMSPLYEDHRLVGIVTVSSDASVFNETKLGVGRIDFRNQRPHIVAALPQIQSSISDLASKVLLRNRTRRVSEEAEVETPGVKADRPPRTPIAKTASNVSAGRNGAEVMRLENEASTSEISQPSKLVAKFFSKLHIGAVTNSEKVTDESFQSEDNSTNKETAYEAHLQRDSMENTSHITELNNGNNYTKEAHSINNENFTTKSVDEEDANSRKTPNSGESFDTRHGNSSIKVVDSEIRWGDLQLKEEVGQGSFAVVYRGIWNGSDVAVKVYYGNQYTEQVLLDYRKEIDIMRRLRHPNVLLFMGAVCTDEKLAIVTEYLTRGSLFKALHKNNQSLDIRRRLKMAIDVARGMNYLHHRNPPIVHRDLKSSNLLVDKSWTVKVGDFGLSKLKCATFLTAKSGRGTPQWMAPEVLRNEPSTEKSDVFSYGVILWELMTQRVPWDDLNSLQVVGVVGFMDRRLEIPSNIDPQVSSIISDCWRSNPEERPSFEDIILKMTELVHPGAGLSARSASVS